MKNILFFILLIVLVVCPPMPRFEREDRNKKRLEFQKKVAECILKSESASADLKRDIEENKDGNLRIVFHNYVTKLNTKDHEIIRNCRKELFEKERAK